MADAEDSMIIEAAIDIVAELDPTTAAAVTDKTGRFGRAVCLKSATFEQHFPALFVGAPHRTTLDLLDQLYKWCVCAFRRRVFVHCPSRSTNCCHIRSDIVRLRVQLQLARRACHYAER